MRYKVLSLFCLPMTAVYTITSGLHNEQSVARLSDAFLSEVFPEGDGMAVSWRNE